jgi:outer membrane receptor for ferrienterochelin and colicins
MNFQKKQLLLKFLVVLLSSHLIFSQEIKRDTTKVELLDEVVITGQYNPQSIKKSVHNVTVIKREQIDNQAANNLADLLNFNLNLNIIPNSKSGKSTISFFGLDSQYFNILIDNVPLISDNGLGNNIDLTQINLDNVKQIEIVEGAMGVEYGSNAVSGVINIITKKSADKKWNIQAFLQEETVSDEYAWFDKGRHIQALNIGHNINENLFVKVGFNRNEFAGFLNNRLGKNHFQNDGLRGYDWLPKTQINSNAFLNYKTKKIIISYKFEYFNEGINYFDAAVRANIDTQEKTSNPSATDRFFTTNRFVNNLNINGKLNSGANYDVAISYQQQQRDLNEFNYFILSKERSNEKDEIYQSSKVFFSKGAINNLVKSDFYNFQIGYETRLIKGFDTQASGNITQQDREQSQENYALFSSSELNITDKFSLRPGVRYEYNSLFHSKLITSLSVRYLMKNGFELRGNIGTSYRTPNFEELYYYFVDSNHDVQGNENLQPENGFTAFLNLKKYSTINNLSLLNAFKISYIDISDKIDLTTVNTTPLQYEFMNIDAYKLWGITSENSIKSNNWTFNLGASLQGISRVANNELYAKDDFLYFYQINTSGTYNIEKWNTAFTLLLKYNGKQQNYISTEMDTNGNSKFSLATTNAFSWLDATVKKSFFNNKITTTLGARNLLDVTSIAVSNANSNAVHSTNNSSFLLGYGRSYYLKLLYNLNF